MYEMRHLRANALPAFLVALVLASALVVWHRMSASTSGNDPERWRDSREDRPATGQRSINRWSGDTRRSNGADGDTYQAIERRPSCSYVPVDWNSLMHFVPWGANKCGGFFNYLDKSKRFPNDAKMTKMYEAFLTEVSKHQYIEGNSGYKHEEQLTYNEIVRAPWVRTICETGFNAGHSAFIWLAANPNTTVYSFDVGYHDYAPKMANYLESLFPGRLHVTWTDSTVSVPEFHAKRPDIKCDIILIDGGHAYAVAKSDMDNFRKMANPAHHLIILDDYPSHIGDFIPMLGRVWEHAKRSEQFLEFFRCTYAPEGGGGFAVGKFIHPCLSDQMPRANRPS